MNKIIVNTLKESVSKEIEKGKEFKNNVENLNVSETKEFSEEQKKIIQEADTDTAMNTSLSSVLEENKKKREVCESKLNETDESGEVKEGLTDEQKEMFGELTGWSDEMLDFIGSWEEVVKYIKAGLKEDEINGKKCLVRDDIDLAQKDEDGITNRERMRRGNPPIAKDGEIVELHHIGQKQNSPLAELARTQHRGAGNDAIFHNKSKETEIDRNEFGKERKEYWKDKLEAIEKEENK